MFGKSKITAGYFAGSLALGLWLGRPACAADLLPDAVGVRGAYSITSIDTGFVQAQVFADWTLPWRWETTNGWYLATGLDLSLGALNGWDTTAFVGSLGPTVRIGQREFPVFLEAGLSPTLLSRHEFGQRNLGCNFQGTSYAGLGVSLGRHWEAGYRFQHMSNGGIAEPNPGLNLQALSLRFNF